MDDQQSPQGPVPVSPSAPSGDATPASPAPDPAPTPSTPSAPAIPAEVKTLVETNLLDVIGLGTLPEAERTTLLAELSQTVLNRVLIRISELLPAEALEEFKQKTESGDSAGADAVLAAHNVNVELLSAEEALKLKAELVQNLDQAKPTA